MLPKPPAREGNLGFLYLPPYRVQGVSMAGEATAVMVPELDIAFDMGSCPRAILSTTYCAISHGHMDHIGSLAYYASQRRFQGMGDAKIVCDARIAGDIHAMMKGFHRLERQETPYDLIELEPEQAIEIKNNIFLRGFPTEHTCPSMGYAIFEKRSKLREEFIGMPQEKLRELKDRGIEITRFLEIPLVAYLGDTLPGPWLIRPDVLGAKIILSECTFFEPEHRERAKLGAHLHIEDIAEWLPVTSCEAMVLQHISRRTNLPYARKRLQELIPDDYGKRVHLLMDHRTNRERYEKQLEAVGGENTANAR